MTARDEHPVELNSAFERLSKDIEALNSQIHERELKGQDASDLRKQLEQLEARKHDIVERKQDVWSS